MLVSVIIPTYNRLQLLQRAISSVEAQSYDEVELIIVDDGSTDGTKEYLEGLKHKVIILSDNCGVSHARNQGVSIAKGETIAFLDSDDLWHEEKLARQVAFHQNRPDILCSFGLEQWFRQGKRVKRPKKYEAAAVVGFENLLEFTFIGPSSVMIEKNLFVTLDGFDESLKVCEDYDLWLRLSQKASMHLVSDVVIEKHAGSEDQLSHSVLSLEPYRVKALMKHKHDDKAKEMIRKKLEIIYKGAVKHNNQELLEFCDYYKKALVY